MDKILYRNIIIFYRLNIHFTQLPKFVIMKRQKLTYDSFKVRFTNLIDSIKLTSIDNQQLIINDFIMLSQQRLEELKLLKMKECVEKFFEKYGIVFGNLTKYYKNCYHMKYIMYGKGYISIDYYQDKVTSFFFDGDMGDIPLILEEIYNFNKRINTHDIKIINKGKLIQKYNCKIADISYDLDYSIKIIDNYKLNEKSNCLIIYKNEYIYYIRNSKVYTYSKIEKNNKVLTYYRKDDKDSDIIEAVLDKNMNEYCKIGSYIFSICVKHLEDIINKNYIVFRVFQNE